MKNITLSLLLFIFYLPTTLNAQNISSSQALSDLRFLIHELENTHNAPYLHITKEQFDAEVAQLRQTIQQTEQLSIRHFARLCMPLLARLGDGHTYISWFEGAFLNELNNARFLGIKVKWNTKGHLIINDDNLPQNGQKILTINGQSANRLFAEAMTYEAGTPSFITHYAEKLLFPIFLELHDIKPPFKIKTNQEEFVFHQNIGLDELSKRFTPSTTPYTFKIVEGDIGYLAYNRCEDYKAFDQFLKETFSTLKKKNIDKLIIDISNNLGGDSSLNDLLLSYITRKKYRQSSGRSWKVSENMKTIIQKPLYLNAFGKSFVNQYLKAENGSYLNEDEYKPQKPKKRKLFFDGKTAFIIGPKTFSSANFLADAIKTYQLSTLIGLPTGELTNDFGEQITLEMPHSKLKFTCSIAFDIGADGDPDKIETVKPDIFVEEDKLNFTINWLRKQ